MPKALSIEPALEQTLSFLEGTANFPQPHITLLKLRAKTMFLQEFRETLSFDLSLQKICEEAAAEDILNHEETSFNKDGYWRRLTFLCLQHVFLLWASQLTAELQAAFVALSKDLAQFMDSCSQLGFDVAELQFATPSWTRCWR